MKIKNYNYLFLGIFNNDIINKNKKYYDLNFIKIKKDLFLIKK